MIDPASLESAREYLRLLPADAPAIPNRVYITFRSRAPGVRIPSSINQRHPHDLTIILDQQYTNLVVSNDTISVTLAFDSVDYRIKIPFSAVRTIANYPHDSVCQQDL